LAWVHVMVCSKDERLFQAFNILDSDCDGLISRQDLLRGANTNSVSASLTEKICFEHNTHYYYECVVYVPLRVAFE
jgi:Ca2+-binding EF-hand superfamily protein